MIKMTNVFNFSGGKTSAYMVIHYWKPGDLVIFTDTGREHPKTYKFIHDFEAHENIPVIKISYKNSQTPFETLLEVNKHKIIHLLNSAEELANIYNTPEVLSICEYNQKLYFNVEHREKIVKESFLNKLCDVQNLTIPKTLI